MSWIEDNDLHAEYYISTRERFDIAISHTDLEIAKVLEENKEYIDKKYKKLTLDITKKVLNNESISEKQRNILNNSYVFNYEIEREY